MRKPDGYAIWTSPEMPNIERDTAQCRHCNAHFYVGPGASPSDIGGWCSCCNGPVCNKNTCNDGCTPFLKKLDAYEQANRFGQAVGLVLD